MIVDEMVPGHYYHLRTDDEFLLGRFVGMATVMTVDGLKAPALALADVHIEGAVVTNAHCAEWRLPVSDVRSVASAELEE